MNELKKCPFCGGRVAMNQDDEGYYVSCCEEGCVVMTNSYAEKEAVEKWNNRKPAEEVVARLEERKKNSLKRCETMSDSIIYRDAIEIVKEGMG